jgi:hypothetical protein
MSRLSNKIKFVYYRLIFALKELPTRIKRLIIHLIWILPYDFDFVQHDIVGSFAEWVFGFPFYIMDIIFLPEIYEITMELFKWNTRFLTHREKELAISVFGNSIMPDLVRIDNRSISGPKQGRFAYVSFQTINCYGHMSDRILIHELVHVWQFLQFGSYYIPKAILAQRSKEGYNYYRTAGLMNMKLRNGRLYNFNFEQQGDIVMDYFNMKQVADNQTVLESEVYEYFMEDILSMRTFG